MTNPPYLIAEIPCGLDDGHVSVVQPGMPLGELEVRTICQRFRAVPEIVEPNLIAVSRDSVQGTGRVGRALLVMYKVDTAKIGSEALQEVKERLLRRLESVESAGSARDREKRPGGHSGRLPVVDRVERSGPPRQAADHCRAGARRADVNGAAPLATSALARARRFGDPGRRGSGSRGQVVTPLPERTPDRSSYGTARGGPARPAPARSADPAAAAPSPIKDEELRNELAAATNNSVDLLDPSRREAFATIWPGRLAKDNASSMRLLYAQYEKAYGKALDFTVDRATSTCQTSVDHAIKEAFTDDGRHTDAVELALRKVEQLFEDMKGLDGWLGKQQTNGPLLDTGLRGDFRKLMDDRRGHCTRPLTSFSPPRPRRSLARR